MARIVCVARDAAPSRAFMRLKEELDRRSRAVKLYVGDGKPLTSPLGEVCVATSEADIVLLGMSSSLELAGPELAAGKTAREAEIPYGFYGDVRRCYNRARPGAWFAELADRAAFYFGVNEGDAEEAKKIFPNARCMGTGNPLREDMAYPKFTRQQVREKLGIADDEFVVLSPGGKCAAINIAQWVVVQDALVILAKYLKELGQKCRLILATHPGDRTPMLVDSEKVRMVMQASDMDWQSACFSGGANADIYKDLVTFAPVPTQFVPKEVLTSSDLVPGADLLVEFGSSIGMEAAAQQIPVVTYCTGIAELRNAKASGTHMTELVELSVSYEVQGSGVDIISETSSIAGTIRELVNASSEMAVALRRRQQAEFPKAERGAAVRKMADALEAIIG